MGDSRITPRQAEKFHGHLGPYLVLGILAGELAVRKLRCKKYFDLEIEVRGANKKPQSCFIDGLQLSTGCTYGKGNIRKIKANKIQILFRNVKNNNKIKISLKDKVIARLDDLKGHKDSENFAKKLYKANPLGIFNLLSVNCKQ